MGHQVAAQQDASPMELRVSAQLASARLDAIRLGTSNEGERSKPIRRRSSVQLASERLDAAKVVTRNVRGGGAIVATPEVNATANGARG